MTLMIRAKAYDVIRENNPYHDDTRENLSCDDTCEKISCDNQNADALASSHQVGYVTSDDYENELVVPNEGSFLLRKILDELRAFKLVKEMDNKFNNKDNSTKSTQITCEEVFNATEKCNTCQKSLYDQGGLSLYTGDTPPSQCPTKIVYGNFLFKEYENAEVDQAMEKIKTDCANEFSVPLDLTVDPKTIDVNTLLAYDTFIAYYGGIPTHESICLLNDQGEYCYYKIIDNYVEYIKKEINGDTNVSISLDGKSIFLHNGTAKEIPKDLNCGECWTKIANNYLTYFEEHKLDEQLEKNIFGGYDEMKKEFEATCEDSTDTEGVDFVEDDSELSVRPIDKISSRKIKRGGDSATRSLFSIIRG
ncbi:16071_t:CDS:2 [Funneliformis geosporum]|uniref:8675_t:CDS:1 n=1 Tax=Funneliformis geosporum TaxID=1117311 RepID=A0A9W4X0I0_9GLOM|nr:16071_t:CDS:2 [Funneliformis geosporum]CAI2186142.1 8675_t:CDS:2 [Funneliformis geosporum]